MVEGRLSEQDSWKVGGVVDESRKAAATVVCLVATILPIQRDPSQILP